MKINNLNYDNYKNIEFQNEKIIEVDLPYPQAIEIAHFLSKKLLLQQIELVYVGSIEKENKELLQTMGYVRFI